MKNFLRYLKNDKKEAILAPIFKCLEAIFDLLVPIIISCMIDNGILKFDSHYVMKMAGILILLAILGMIMSMIAQYFAAKASVGLGTTLKEKLFEQVQHFSFQDLDEIHESTILSRMTTDTEQVQNGVNLLLRLALRSPFIVFGSLIMAFVIDRKVGMIFAFTIPLIAFILWGITQICVPRYEQIQNRKDALLDITKQMLEGTRVIRAFGIEEQMGTEFEKENAIYTKWQKKTAQIASWNQPLNYGIINVGIMVILVVGGKQVDFGILSTGQVVALYHYMSQILVELVKLTNLLLLFPKTIASFNRIEKLLNGRSFLPNGLENWQEEKVNLVFENVCLNYTNQGENALENINFQAKTGESIGIIGGTGAGKTSLVNLIPRFYEATSGNIKINGKNIKNYEINSLRKNIGIVAQKKVLFRGTIKSNIEFGNGTLKKEAIKKALQISQSQEFVEKMEKGMDEKVEENGKNFSGGQRQRLTIARAIAQNPKILIFDDSMSALDLLTERKLRHELESLKKNKILIFVSQRISTIQNLDKILVLDNGKLVGQGNHAELLEKCSIYQEIYQSQLKKEEP